MHLTRRSYAWAEDKEHCLAPGTEVLLADGRRRAIGDCTVGDMLLDEHGAARAVIRCSRGVGPMFTVHYGSGNGRFDCNGAHQLVVYLDATAAHPHTGMGCSRVTHHELMFDDALGFVVPVPVMTDFAVAGVPGAHAADTPIASAETAQQSRPPHYIGDVK